MIFLLTLAVQAGPAVLPFDGGKEAGAAQKAFATAAKEAKLPFTLPTKVLGVELRPTVQACKGDLICLTQIGTTLGAAQIIYTKVSGTTANSQVIATADATVVREVTVNVGGDAVRAYKDAVFSLFGQIKSGDIEVLGLPGDAIVSIDDETRAVTKRFNAKPGVRTLKVTAPGFETWTREVFVRSGDVTAVRFAATSLGPDLVVPVGGEQPALEPLGAAPELVALPSVKKKPATPTATVLPATSPMPEPLAAPPPKKKIVKVAVREAPPPTSQPIVVRELTAAPVEPDLVGVKKAEPERKHYKAPWIAGAVLTVGALATAGAFTAMYNQSVDDAKNNPVQVRAQQSLDAATPRGNVATAMWITGGALAATTLALYLILDLKGTF